MSEFQAPHPIVPREKLQFGLDGDIPTYWFGGDPFKSRFWDALSIIFPPGEKYFMQCVRAYRDQIDDAQLQQDIRDFNRQEAQHSMVHRQDNERLRRQGVDVDGLSKYVDDLLNVRYRNRFSARYNLAITSALEHFTSIFAHSIFDKRDVMRDADHRVRAMYAWHAIEEVEHKAVAFDVMRRHAGVGYVQRTFALLHATLMFPATIFRIQRQLLIHDGFNLRQRLALMAKGLWWLLKPGGLLAPMHAHYVHYYRAGFHPWDEADQPGYEEWLKAYASHNADPVQASEDMRKALALA